jgi:hypothetical protein
MPCRCSTSDPANFAEARREKCKACVLTDWSVDGGICLPTAAQHGAERANIEHGIQRPSLRCPEGEWESVAVQCPRCKRGEPQVFPEAIGMCKWCQMKYGARSLPVMGANPVKKKAVTLAADPFSRKPVYHLHYFIYPRFADSVQYHLEKLKQYSGVVNGKRVVCVATDDRTIQDTIAPVLSDYFDIVYHRPNDPRRRELVGFIDTLSHFADSGADDVIMFAHAKGQQDWTHESSTIRQWCDVMYDTTLGNVNNVTRAMSEGYAVAGPFRVVGQFRSTPYRWHYSGTFFAARAHRVFETANWQKTCRHFWGSESWVGRHFHLDESKCLFCDHIPGGMLYRPEFWEQRVAPEIAKWEATCESN